MKTIVSFFVALLSCLPSAFAFELDPANNWLLAEQGQPPLVERAVAANAKRHANKFSYIEIIDSNGTLSYVRVGEIMFKVGNSSSPLNTNQLYDCFNRLNLGENERGLIFMQTSPGKWVAFNFVGMSAEAWNSTKMTQFRCD